MPRMRSQLFVNRSIGVTHVRRRSSCSLEDRTARAKAIDMERFATALVRIGKFEVSVNEGACMTTLQAARQQRFLPRDADVTC